MHCYLYYWVWLSIFGVPRGSRLSVLGQWHTAEFVLPNEIPLLSAQRVIKS